MRTPDGGPCTCTLIRIAIEDGTEDDLTEEDACEYHDPIDALTCGQENPYSMKTITPTPEQAEKLLGLFTGETVKVHVTIAKEQILADLAAGLFAVEDIECFADLHDHVDANEYGRLEDVEASSNDQRLIICNRVQDALDRWIREGGLS